jgi:hypothetical protein
MVNLHLDREWLEPGFQPESLTDSPFGETLPATLAWGDVAAKVKDHSAWEGTLESYGAALVEHLRGELLKLKGGSVHLAVSGGYDSRILAYLAEDSGLEPTYITDGSERPASLLTRDYLGVPEERRYLHDMNQDDPYGVADVTINGWAPLYFGMTFFPADSQAALVTGLGGGEWFSYRAADWHNGHLARTPRQTMVDWWMDTWPNYWLIPASWGNGYRKSVHPYCQVGYARLAARCKDEWLVETQPDVELDAVREAMLNHLDPDLIGLGYAHHVYDWGLTAKQRERIDARFRESWLGQLPEVTDAQPSLMDQDVWSCTMGGLATWCESLMAEGHALS